jgi:hypothetical protein
VNIPAEHSGSDQSYLDLFHGRRSSWIPPAGSDACGPKCFQPVPSVRGWQMLSFRNQQLVTREAHLRTVVCLDKFLDAK